MGKYVLVHGAWGGAWGWRQFTPLLWSKGHEVFAPTLTGLGERVHLGGPETDLSTHIEDVLNVLFYEDLNDIVLVGHSYGGMVITGVADRAPERIAHLVYIDAFLPKDGESCYDLGGAGGRPPPGDEWRVGFGGGPPGAAGPAAPLPPELQAFRARMTPQPRGTLEEKARLSVPLEERPFTRTYIKAGVDMTPPGADPRPAQRRGAFWDAAERTRNDPAWRYFELPCGHGVQREMPQALAGILLQVIEPAPPPPFGPPRQ